MSVEAALVLLAGAVIGLGGILWKHNDDCKEYRRQTAEKLGKICEHLGIKE